MVTRFTRRAGILTLVLVACSTAGTIDGPVLSSPRPFPFTGGGMDAIVAGVVTYDETTNCLYLKNGESIDPVVWPGGARWQADPPAVRLGDQFIEVGSSVQGAGGYVSWKVVRDAAGELIADAAVACGGGDIALFNADSELRVGR